MLATYITIPPSLRPTTGFDTNVLADWVGILTGTITSPSQLSSAAQQTLCKISGTQYPWEVYDADAHPGYPGKFKVLRRLNTDTLTYSYMLIGFVTTNYTALTIYALNGCIGFMGGWDSTLKRPTTAMVLSNGGTVPASTVLSTSTLAMSFIANSDAMCKGSANSVLWDFALGNGGSTGLNAPMPYTILNTPALFFFFAQSVTNANSFPMGFVAEHDGSNVYSNPTVGVKPIVYGAQNNSGANYALISSPEMKDTVGDTVTPSYTQLISLFSNQCNSTNVPGYLHHPSTAIPNFTKDAAGNLAIPITPIDVQQITLSNGWACYAGRLKELFATLPGSFPVGTTFNVGSDKYLVLPCGGYSGTPSAYSPAGKLVAKIK